MGGLMAYESPRWSREITDCSMPMTLDTYSVCSYSCTYCFSAFQRAVDQGDQKNKMKRYLHKQADAVNVEKVKRIFTEPGSSQFWPYIEQRRVLQWGGLSDQFDEFERERGVTLELLRFFREIEYPISFSTKATWWVYDPRYRECFEGFPWFNVKFSIISLDEERTKSVEALCPTPTERLDAMREAAGFVGGGVTLRLRPFIIGLSNPGHVGLIERAVDAGASAVSTEFFCLEERSYKKLKKRFDVISRAVGFDILAFYKKYSIGGGYLRLNRNVKRQFVDEMGAACQRLGLRFYVSDAHFKERCASGSCCGLPESWNYSRGHFTEALLLAKRKGRVYWSDIAPHLDYAKTFLWRDAQGYNATSSENRGKFHQFTMFDYLHYLWNKPNKPASPYKMFEGVMHPEGLDENSDVIYAFNEERA
jgi:DNA repair photolyase